MIFKDTLVPIKNTQLTIHNKLFLSTLLYLNTGLLNNPIKNDTEQSLICKTTSEKSLNKISILTIYKRFNLNIYTEIICNISYLITIYFCKLHYDMNPNNKDKNTLSIHEEYTNNILIDNYSILYNFLDNISTMLSFKKKTEVSFSSIKKIIKKIFYSVLNKKLELYSVLGIDVSKFNITRLFLLDFNNLRNIHEEYYFTYYKSILDKSKTNNYNNCLFKVVKSYYDSTENTKSYKYLSMNIVNINLSINQLIEYINLLELNIINENDNELFFCVNLLIEYISIILQSYHSTTDLFNTNMFYESIKALIKNNENSEINLFDENILTTLRILINNNFEKNTVNLFGSPTIKKKGGAGGPGENKGTEQNKIQLGLVDRISLAGLRAADAALQGVSIGKNEYQIGEISKGALEMLKTPTLYEGMERFNLKAIPSDVPFVNTDGTYLDPSKIPTPQQAYAEMAKLGFDGRPIPQAADINWAGVGDKPFRNFASAANYKVIEEGGQKFALVQYVFGHNTRASPGTIVKDFLVPFDKLPDKLQEGIQKGTNIPNWLFPNFVYDDDSPIMIELESCGDAKVDEQRKEISDEANQLLADQQLQKQISLSDAVFDRENLKEAIHEAVSNPAEAVLEQSSRYGGRVVGWGVGAANLFVAAKAAGMGFAVCGPVCAIGAGGVSLIGLNVAEQKILDKSHDLVHNAQKNIIENAARDAMPSCPGGICEPEDIDVENYLDLAMPQNINLDEPTKIDLDIDEPTKIDLDIDEPTKIDNGSCNVPIETYLDLGIEPICDLQEDLTNSVRHYTELAMTIDKIIDKNTNVVNQDNVNDNTFVSIDIETTLEDAQYIDATIRDTNFDAAKGPENLVKELTSENRDVNEELSDLMPNNSQDRQDRQDRKEDRQYLKAHIRGEKFDAARGSEKLVEELANENRGVKEQLSDLLPDDPRAQIKFRKGDAKEIMGQIRDDRYIKRGGPDNDAREVIGENIDVSEELSDLIADNSQPQIKQEKVDAKQDRKYLKAHIRGEKFDAAKGQEQLLKEVIGENAARVRMTPQEIEAHLVDLMDKGIDLKDPANLDKIPQDLLNDYIDTLEDYNQNQQDIKDQGKQKYRNARVKEKRLEAKGDFRHLAINKITPLEPDEKQITETYNPANFSLKQKIAMVDTTLQVVDFFIKLYAYVPPQILHEDLEILFKAIKDREQYKKRNVGVVGMIFARPDWRDINPYNREISSIKGEQELASDVAQITKNFKNLYAYTAKTQGNILNIVYTIMEKFFPRIFSIVYNKVYKNKDESISDIEKLSIIKILTDRNEFLKMLNENQQFVSACNDYLRDNNITLFNLIKKKFTKSESNKAISEAFYLAANLRFFQHMDDTLREFEDENELTFDEIMSCVSKDDSINFKKTKNYKDEIDKNNYLKLVYNKFIKSLKLSEVNPVLDNDDGNVIYINKIFGKGFVSILEEIDVSAESIYTLSRGKTSELLDSKSKIKNINKIKNDLKSKLIDDYKENKPNLYNEAKKYIKSRKYYEHLDSDDDENTKIIKLIEGLFVNVINETNDEISSEDKNRIIDAYKKDYKIFQDKFLEENPVTILKTSSSNLKVVINQNAEEGKSIQKEKSKGFEIIYDESESDSDDEFNTILYDTNSVDYLIKSYKNKKNKQDSDESKKEIEKIYNLLIKKQSKEKLTDADDKIILEKLKKLDFINVQPVIISESINKLPVTKEATNIELEMPSVVVDESSINKLPIISEPVISEPVESKVTNVEVQTPIVIISETNISLPVTSETATIKIQTPDINIETKIPDVSNKLILELVISELDNIKKEADKELMVEMLKENFTFKKNGPDVVPKQPFINNRLFHYSITNINIQQQKDRTPLQSTKKATQQPSVLEQQNDRTPLQITQKTTQKPSVLEQQNDRTPLQSTQKATQQPSILEQKMDRTPLQITQKATQQPSILEQKMDRTPLQRTKIELLRASVLEEKIDKTPFKNKKFIPMDKDNSNYNNDDNNNDDDNKKLINENVPSTNLEQNIETVLVNSSKNIQKTTNNPHIGGGKFNKEIINKIFMLPKNTLRDIELIFSTLNYLKNFLFMFPSYGFFNLDKYIQIQNTIVECEKFLKHKFELLGGNITKTINSTKNKKTIKHINCKKHKKTIKHINCKKHKKTIKQ